VRRICWQPPESPVEATLIAMGARRWQAQIAAPILQAALLEKAPLEVEDAGEEDAISD